MCICIASSHISVTVDLVTDTVVFLFEKKKMQIGEVALKKLKGYNNLHFLSKTKHKGARVFLLLLFSFFLHTIWYNSAFIRLPHLYRQLLLHYFITYSTLRDAESKLGLRLLIYPIVYGHSHRKSYHRYIYYIYLFIYSDSCYLHTVFFKKGNVLCKHALSIV